MRDLGIMAGKFHQPIRMCVSCRERKSQHSLIRLQCIDETIKSFSGKGRSIYFCNLCIDDEKKISKALMRQCRSSQRDKLMSKLKEIITDDRKS